MKRFIISLLSLIICLVSFAQNETPAVSMVSYEQTWIDHKGTLALKNNTEETVHNIAFMITYLDMNNNPVDYKEFTYNIEIEPGMTKKLDIPAYEDERDYHYYKTPDEYGHPAFKIRYDLKGYNLVQEDKDEYYETSSSTGIDTKLVIFFLVLILFALGIVIGSFVLVAVVAQKNRRNVVIWLLLSMISSPVLILIILLVIGKNKNIEE